MEPYSHDRRVLVPISDTVIIILSAGAVVTAIIIAVSDTRTHTVLRLDYRIVVLTLPLLLCVSFVCQCVVYRRSLIGR